MLAIMLTGFSEAAADQINADLAPDGYDMIRRPGVAGLLPGAAAARVCADRDGWLGDICEIRAISPHMVLIVVTSLPEHTIWLDALEAGANDYACMPLDRQQLRWLFRRAPQSESSGRTRKALAS